MNSLLVKVVPTAVVLAVGGYVVWPYLGPGAGADGGGGAAPAAKAKPGELEVPAAVLRPVPPPPPARDPFEDPEERRAVVRAAVRKALKELAERLEERRSARPKRPTARTGPVAPQPQADRSLDGLTLNATYIQGGQAAAVINGRVYRPGQRVDAGGLTLAEVRLHSVVLRQGGRDLELKYAGRGGAGRPAARPRPPQGQKPQSPPRRGPRG